MRLIVENTTHAAGRTSCAHAAIVDAGSGTCSSNSMQVTTSKVAGVRRRERFGGNQPVLDRGAGFELVQFRHAQRLFRQVDAGDLGALRCHRFGEDAAAAADIEYALVVQARRSARRCSRSRSGLMSCSGLNSLVGSHQRCASALNLASSAGSALRCSWSLQAILPVARPRGEVLRVDAGEDSRSATSRSPPTQTSVT